jgi:hypothetical protein
MLEVFEQFGRCGNIVGSIREHVHECHTGEEESEGRC